MIQSLDLVTYSHVGENKLHFKETTHQKTFVK